ncbi:hypothetical protein GCM10020000_71320 [Streptomyces olivoverticillatus]
MLRPLLDALEGPMRGTDCSSLLSVSSSGAILSESVRAQFARLLPSVALLNNFGSSESGFNGTATGEPGTGFRLRVNDRTSVVDPVTHRPVEPGAVGRIAQRGHVPLGYHNDPPARPPKRSSRGAASGGCCSGTWRPSMPTAWSPSSGAARSASTPGGEKVFPEEVEQVLKGHPAVYDVLVAGVPDARWGQRVTAVVQPREGADPPTLAVLQAHCRAHLAGYKVPRSVVLAACIRRSPSGKADYRWARAVAEAPDAPE